MSKPQAMRFSVKDVHWVKTPEFGGGECVFYRSPDRTRVVAAFQESGAHTFEYPFDEFAYVLKGSAKVSVHGGESFSIGPGDVLYVEEGAVIDFEMSEDFEDITMLVSNRPVAWR